jgi:hypothetical protein
MRTKTSYERELRLIGQALETRGITVFELKNQSGQYVVSGTPDKSSVIANIRRLLQGAAKGAPGPLHFSHDELDRIDQLGKKKRAKSDRLPDFYNLSNTLRTLGGYLKAKDAELLELHKRPLSVTLLYRNNRGHPHMEDRTIASFFNLFVEMHGRRNRPAS